MLHIDCRGRETVKEALARFGPENRRDGTGETSKKERTVRTEGNLRIPRHGSQLSGQEVIRRPWSTDDQLAVLQLLGCAGVTILIFFHRLRVDQVSDVDEHSVGIDPFTTYFFFEGIKQLVHLNRQCPGLGRAFAILGSFFAKLHQVVAADRIWQWYIRERLAQSTVFDQNF